ncbi:hypothetical protein M011DRAFT_466661 [Sporormia fimetaria CBS 119925]|uniref:Uncharacterized protein n=1 Tax=Sporormia fimetaria CBS 119925 TaxID=1340428 RepID=A0A6A6VH49_9PLEO|nr:hypothetical protein M011DRAFT_466661 [Sporormia fimetaria CBS 119925]
MLGQVLEDDLYRDMVMSALIARVKESTKDEVIACVDTVPVGIISKIYQLTPAGSPLRQLLVDLVVRHSGDAWFKRERYRGLPKDFLDEVLLGTVYETGRRLAKPKAKRLTEERAGVRRTEDAEKRSPADTTQQGTAPQPRDTWPWPPELVPVTEGSRPLASAMKSDKSKVNAAPKKVTFESDPRPELVGAEFGRDECEYHLHRKTKNTCWKKSCWGRHQKGCSG